MSKLSELEAKVDNPGKYGAPTDNDLKYMIEKYYEMKDYFRSIGDIVVTSFLWVKITTVESIIYARKV